MTVSNVCSLYLKDKGRATAATAPGCGPNLVRGPDMLKRICSADGCERPYLAQGMCSMHYQRGKANGSLAKLPPREKYPCSVDGCDRDAVGMRDWCSKHWRLVQQYGTPASPNRPKPDKTWLESLDVPAGSQAVPVLISRAEGFTYALVDTADYDDVVRWRWYRVANGYASRHGKDGRKYMHRYLMQTPQGMDTDHINRNKLDNRRSNLRIVDRSTNNFNTPPSKANTSGVKGVGWFKPAGLWRAYIKHQSEPKRIELGYFKTFEEAVAARQSAEERLIGKCA